VKSRETGYTFRGIGSKSFIEKGFGVPYRNFAVPRNFIIAKGFEQVIAPENDRVSKESP
jgi:hypothetical protein